MSYTTGFAKESDIPKVARLIYDGIIEIGEEANLPKPDIDLVIDQVVKNYYIAPIVCLFNYNNIVGAVPLKIANYYWSPKVHLTSLLYYILPKHRSFANIKKLTSSVKEFASLQGISYKDYFTGTKKNDARRRLMRCNGFKEIGIMMEFQNGQ